MMTAWTIIAVCFLGLFAVNQFFALCDEHNRRREFQRGQSTTGADPACTGADASGAEFDDAVFHWPARPVSHEPRCSLAVPSNKNGAPADTDAPVTGA